MRRIKRLMRRIKKFIHVERKRSLAKVLGWRLISILTDALIIYLLYPLGATATAVGFILAENTYATLIGYAYERIWTHIKWGIKVKKGDEKL